MAFCSIRFLLLLFTVSVIPIIAFLISLELAKPATHVYYYRSSGFFRETAKWDDLNRRFLVGFMEGGVGQVVVPDDHSPDTILEEVVVIKDVELQGNASLGILIDRPRNRLLVVTADVRGKKYSGLAAYDLSTWKRQFLAQLSGPSDEKSFADDVAVDSDGNAYVTDVKNNKIWKVGADGEFISTIKNPLFIPKEWYKNLFGLNGIVYHPDGFLIVVHTLSGDLFKIDLDLVKGDRDHEAVKLINVSGNGGRHLRFGDGMELLSPTRLVVARNPYSRLVESLDGWETAAVVGTFSGLKHRWASAATVSGGRVFINHMLGMGYPEKKHAIVEAVFSAEG